MRNDTLLRALMREATPYTPVWIMRQAGRYLPEYNETRKRAGSFLKLAQTPELACEVTLQPLRRFHRPLRDERAIRALEPPALEKLAYVFDAIALTRRELHGKVPLIGFSGSPFTLACYMVEGGGSDDFRLVKSMLYAQPELLHRILDVNARAVTAYLNAQIAAGAQAVMLFDTWGGVLADAAFHEFSLAYSKRVLEGLTRTNDGRIV